MIVILKCIPVGALQANCYIVGDSETKEVVIIDPGAEWEKIYNEIDSNEYKVHYIIATHGHGDHIGAIKDLKGKIDAEVVIHKEDSGMLRDSRLNLSKFTGDGCTQISHDIIVEDEDELLVGQHKFKFIHTPGHTRGGVCILVDKKLFSGDTLFQNTIGRTDLPGGDYQQILNALKNKLMVLSDDIEVYPGHGSSTTIGIERQTNPYIVGK